VGRMAEGGPGTRGGWEGAGCNTGLANGKNGLLVPVYASNPTAQLFQARTPRLDALAQIGCSAGAASVGSAAAANRSL